LYILNIPLEVRLSHQASRVRLSCLTFQVQGEKILDWQGGDFVQDRNRFASLARR
jgi:hypothetical protein